MILEHAGFGVLRRESGWRLGWLGAVEVSNVGFEFICGMQIFGGV